MTSIIKVDNLQNQCGANIISESSNVITIGASGDTVTLAAGASQSGFGRSGSVNWDTTPKTTTVTAISGNGYFINTTSAGVTVNLPAGTAGAIVALADYAATWNTNAVTVNANGTEKIGGIASSPATLNTQGQAVTLVYVDATEGWINVGDATAVKGNVFVAATGGTIATCGDFKTHVFTGPGTFTVTNAGTPAGSTSVEYLVVAGGGGGGTIRAGAGGAGGFRQNYPSPAVAGLPVTATSYPITVGAGGAGMLQPAASPTNYGISGSNSIFSTITSAGGGAAGYFNVGLPGGSGGGGSLRQGLAGGTGNTPPVSPSQGNNGGSSLPGCVGGTGGGGGGGASTAGGNASIPIAGAGGTGSPIATAFFGPTAPSYGTPGPAPGRYFAGGGGGGTSAPAYSPQAPIVAGAGGSGGGGNGGSPSVVGADATVNTGGGGGGGSDDAVPVSGSGGSGGSGIVVIRYKFQ